MNKISQNGIDGPPNRTPVSWHEKPVSRRDTLIFAVAYLAGRGVARFTESERRRPGSRYSHDGGVGLVDKSTSQPEIDGAGQEHEKTELDYFMDAHLEVAKEVQQRWGVPHEVTLAMGALESGYGKSELANKASNFHGLKANEEWSGDIYDKITREHVPGGDLETWSYVGEPKLIKEGTYEIEIIDEFKAFDAPQDGFHGFGEHLRTRFGGDAYRDAFEHTDPYDFVRALFDTEGAQYATDIAYVDKVLNIMDQITGRTEVEFKSDLDMPSWSELSDVQKSQFGSAENYSTVTERLALTKPSIEGFREFTENITDISEQVAQMDGANQIFPGPEKFRLIESPRIVLHYTAWEKSAWGHDGMEFMSSVINQMKNTGRKASANLYLSRDAYTLYRLTPEGHASYHAGGNRPPAPFYNAESTGLEIPALTQADITPELYEGAVYTVAWQYRKHFPDKKPTQQEMRKYVIGHGEIAEFYPEVTTHSDFPRAAADAVADLVYQLLQQV